MSMSMRVLAVDDEPLALQRLEWCLRDLPEVELVGKARDGRRALELIRSLSPDVVLLDIEMPELNGFELIDALGDEELPQVVFVTAFDHFAVQAFATGSRRLSAQAGGAGTVAHGAGSGARRALSCTMRRCALGS